MDEPAFGALPSFDDYRDGVVASGVVGAATPAALPVSYQSTLGPVLYQRKIPACVAHDIVDMIKLWWFREHDEWVDFSPRFLDILSAEPWIPLDGGRVPRTVLKIAAKYGVCTTKTLPNDTTLSIAAYRDPAAITAAAREEALKYRIPGFLRIPLDFQSTREAILRYGMVSTLFQIGEELWVPSWAAKDTVPLRTPKVVVSGHQMGQKGWVSAALNSLRNEWSDAWARMGETDFDWNKWKLFISEQWAIAQIPKDTASFLADLPAPTDFHYQWDHTMVRGDYSQDVKMAQVALMILGYMEPVAPEDFGHYGPKTSKAVLKYQSAKRILPVAPDSIGPKTRAALNADFAL